MVFVPVRYLITDWNPSDLCSSSCSFISSRSDHNFIPVYWPKFIGKAKTKRNRSNLKNWSRFSELYGSTTIRTGSYFFPIERFLKLKKLQNWEVHDYSCQTIRFGLGFKTIGQVPLKDTFVLRPDTPHLVETSFVSLNSCYRWPWVELPPINWWT